MMTVKEAAARACVSESLIYAWCQAGVLPHARFGRTGRRGTIRIEAADLETVIQTMKASGAPRGGNRRAVPNHPPLKHIKLQPDAFFAMSRMYAACSAMWL